ncbi:MAG: accessory gene regulator B family protein [Defluviitaleaceae bacterium]|nr:accessory gene regulator B family protein [Defluviitaleaceae bacterium]
MENELIQRTAKVLTRKINCYTCKDGLELQKMELGMEILLINVSKIIIIYLLAILLGILGQTLIIHGAFMLTKRYSFGLHALNSTVCTVLSCCMFVFIPLLLSDMGISNPIVLTVFPVIISILYRYAPADTKARPIIGVKLRKQLKYKSIAFSTIAMAIALIVPNESLKLLMVLGAAYQSISILPITYKILKRSEKNYEMYECA